jgi:phage-related minor tail protein
MAADNSLKGLTIEIGGDTSNLQTALKGTNSEIANLQHNLRAVETALKLDPGNVTALTQKTAASH